MKKFTLFLIASFCIVSFANAQISKGSLYLGGNLGFSSVTETDETPANPSAYERKDQGISINPAIGWAIKQNLILGVEFNYNGFSNEYATNLYLEKNRTTGGTVFLRRYLPISKRFYAFGQIGAGYADTHNESRSTVPFNTNTMMLDGWSTFINFYPGISYNLHKSFFLEMGLSNLFNASYGQQKQSLVSSNGQVIGITNRKLFNIGTSLSGSTNLNVGFRFIIPHK